MRWLAPLAFLLAAACIPWVRHVPYETYSPWINPPVDLVAPDIGPVLGEPNEVFLVDGTYWTRYQCRWFSSGDDYAWSEVPEANVPREVLALPRGPYGAWGCEPGVHGW